MAVLSKIFSKSSLRKAVFFIHLWFGLIVGLYFSAIGLTGSILVFKEDLEASRVMPERDYVAPPTPNAPLMPLATIIEGLKTQFPEAREAELAFANPPARQGGAYLMRLTANKEAEPTTIDPYTGKVIQRCDHDSAFLNWCEDLHVRLLFGFAGKIANGWGGLLSGVLLLSGLWLWWPATLRQIKIRSSIKWGANKHRVISDLHNVMGIYLYAVLLVVTLTGSVIVFYAPVQNVVAARFGSARTPRVPQINPAPGAKRLSIDALMRIAETTSPDSHYVFVLYPTAPKQLFYAYRRAPAGILPDTRIYIDPYTGKILQVGREATDPTTKKIMRSASTIHFGRWGYLGVKLVYFVVGLLPFGLFLTGVLMYIRRFRSKRASKARRAAKTALPNAS